MFNNCPQKSNFCLILLQIQQFLPPSQRNILSLKYVQSNRVAYEMFLTIDTLQLNWQRYFYYTKTRQGREREREEEPEKLSIYLVLSLREREEKRSKRRIGKSVHLKARHELLPVIIVEQTQQGQERKHSGNDTWQNFFVGFNRGPGLIRWTSRTLMTSHSRGFGKKKLKQCWEKTRQKVPFLL